MLSEADPERKYSFSRSMFTSALSVVLKYRGTIAIFGRFTLDVACSDTSSTQSR